MGIYINKGNLVFKKILRSNRLFKSSSSSEVFVGVYLTGILPMIKFNTESALNNFDEYSMVARSILASLKESRSSRACSPQAHPYSV